MKVYLGPYKNKITCDIYTNYMHKKYGYWNWDEDSTKFESFLHKIEDGIQFFLNMTINKIRSTERKELIKIDKYDTWSADDTLTLIILPMLKQLKDTKQGSPLVDDEDVPESLRNGHLEDYCNKWHTDDPETLRKCEEYSNLLHAKWDWVIDEMIFAFEMKARVNWESDFYKYESISKDNIDYKETVCGMKLIWEDKEGREVTQKRISNGFKLFGAYFEGLWD